MDKITMEDIMQWLGAQRTDANARLVALGDGDEPHAEHSPESKAVRIIDAIVKRMSEMTAVEFVGACEEICAGRKCYDCPLNIGFCPAHGIRRAIEIVKKWKEEQDGND